MRKFRKNAHGATLFAAAALSLALVLAACGSGVSEDNEPSGGGAQGDGEPVASQMVLGGPPECPERPFCLPGLKDTYGIEFSEFKPLDVGGPLTVKALKGGQIDVALLFSTSSAIVANDFVLLEDDKALQTAENIAPLVGDKIDDSAAELLDQVSAALTTENITELNGRVELDQEDPADVAADFLEQEGISGDGGDGSGELTVGAVAFAENQIVAEMYAQVLEHAGYAVERDLDLRSRESSQSALEAGQIDVKPEYLSSLLLFLDPGSEASADAADVAGLNARLLRPRGITLLTPSPAEDTNQFVANAETAERFDLTTMSSLIPVADQLAVGGPPECPLRPFCLPGLKRVYGIVFNDFIPLDAGGPLTVDALRRDEVQVGLLFSTDPRIEQQGFVPLSDDRRLQDAENITPVIRSEKLNDEVRGLLDAVSARLTTDEMTELVGQVVIDGQGVATVATRFLTRNGLL